MTERITLGHGSGGKLSAELIDGFKSVFRNPILNRLEDSAVFPFSGRMAFTTDSFVVNPLFFPGGNIGSLAVTGTVNDLCAVGAKPLHLSLALIIEEGFEFSRLKKIINSARLAAEGAGCRIVTGDTKVVEAGKADGIYINPAGCGIIPETVRLGREKIRPGDLIAVNGSLGEHAAAVLMARNEFALSGRIKSDAAPLNGLVAGLLSEFKTVHFIRDVTRGGLATILTEVSQDMSWGIEVFEEKIPFRRPVLAVAEILGLDPLYFACEGRAVFFISPKESKEFLARMKKSGLGRSARIIGRVVSGPAGRCLLRTGIGGTRVLEKLSGEQLPRIC